MRKKSVLLIVLLLLAVIATASYAITYRISYQKYLQWKEEVISRYPVEMQPYITPKLFVSTREGLIFTYALYGLLAMWLGIAVYAKKFVVKRKHPIVVSAIIFMLFTPLCTPLFTNTASASTVEVDILLVGDEEFMNFAYYLGLFRWVPASQIVYDGAMPAVRDCFYTEFGITFYWDFGWVEWESNDTETNAAKLLIDAIESTGFDDGLVIDGRDIEILMVWTGQYLEDLQGYSPYWLNATICSIYLLGWIFLDNLAQHELTHQFTVPDCNSDGCVMNEEDAMLSNSWCDGCKQLIEANKDRFENPSPPPPPPPNPGCGRSIHAHPCTY